MTNDQYFSLEANLMADDHIKLLHEAHGQLGFAHYITLLLELRKHKGYKCKPVTLRELSKLYDIDMNRFESIVRDFNLFKVKGEGEDAVITSVYLNRVMKRLESKRKKQSDAGRKSAELTKRADNGKFTSLPGTEEKSKEEKNRVKKSKETTTIVVVDDNNAAISNSNTTLKDWETYLNEAVRDESWINLLGAKSGMGKLFIDHRQAIIEDFRQHVHLHGTGTGIQSAKDIKYYLASFLRPGSVTQKNLVSKLLQADSEQHKTSVYRHETVDPQTGARSYFGNPIPADAPPRPNANANWSDELKQWL